MMALRLKGHKADIGYVLARPHWNKGYMTEAWIAVLKWAFSFSEVYRVWAVCDVENLASVQVLEKLGMSREKILRRWIVHRNVSDEPRDCFAYSKIRAAE